MTGCSFKIADDDSAVVGFMIEGYLLGAHSRWPSWLNVASAAGISNDALDAFGLAPPTHGVARQAVVATFVGEIRDAWETTNRGRNLVRGGIDTSG